ncbi:MGH1-like glycoside hydrolase domain-containing protein [Actinoplanes sp. NPDC004185]
MAFVHVGVVAVMAAGLLAPAPPVYPPVGTTTTILDHAALLGSTPEPAWYEANIPFVDVPDTEIRDTYYYRWRTFKEALKYTGPADGWIVSEFLGPVGYSAPSGGIDAAAGHHLYEGRWLRDSRYLDDYLDYWLTGSGSGPKPATEDLNRNTTDWAHQYSFWAVDAAVARAQVSGDWGFLIERLPALRKQYEGWKATNFDAAKGVYWQTPVWDAMEYTAGSYQSSDPYHGGDAYRPTINAYQYGDARALAQVERKAGNRGNADRLDKQAADLRTAAEKVLWDPESSFYKHVPLGGTAIADREQIGYVPWYFHMAPSGNAAAWAQLTDPQGFSAPYGPTTTERRSPWFMHDALAGCCRWDGPSWPFATSQTLTALANQLIDYPAQPYVTTADYVDLLHRYAVTQRKNGRPYVAEAHHPDEDRWIYDGAGHSEDYNHSTFTDLVLSGLLGIRPQAGNTVRINPLAPGSWTHFAAENVAYHGHNLSIGWDRDGTAYGRGSGFRVWVDGVLKLHRPTVGDVTIAVPAGPSTAQPELVDDLANVTETGYPAATASYTWSGDTPANAVDGQDFHLDVPTTRWSSYGSPNRSDWLAVDLGAATVISDVRVDFYDDGGGVRVPDSFALQYQDSAGSWRDVPGQQRTPATPVARAINRILVDPPLTTDRLRVVAVRADGGATGITALQAWRRPDPQVSVGFAETSVAVKPGQPVTVHPQVRADRPARLSLEVPRGWTARKLNDTSWAVTPAADADPAAGLPIRALATTDRGVSSATLATRFQFDPADYPAVVWDDDFSTDRLSSYRIDRPAAEPSPRLAVTDGAVVATADSRAFAVLAAPVSGGTVAILEPSRFAGSGPEDSVFLGFSSGAANNALAWYNNNFGTSGADVRTDGAGRPEATGGCCAAVRWSSGDRIAVLNRSGKLTTWWEHAGQWSLLHTAPVAAAVPSSTLETWSPAFGLRLDGNALAVTRFTVRR